MPQPPSRDRDPGRRGSREQRPRSPAAERLAVPGHSGEPIGRDRAQRSQGAPPRRRAPVDEVGPPRPSLPTDEQPQLPRGVVREIERALGKGPKSHDIALCLSIGSQAIEEDRPDVAVQVLSWARHQAPRLPAVREAYGIALYHQQRWADALSELQAYRRMTDRTDQNHVIADCLRALDRGLEQVASAAEPLVGDEQAPEDRRAEAAIVWAATLAESGDVGAGRAVLRRFLERPRSGDAEHDLRVRYLAADLAEQARDDEEAGRQFELIAAVDDDFLDVPDRLEGLRARQG
ncbi:MAG: hypothetical protein R6U94_04385 [Nitriliruptoraceae bacterium]